MIDAGILLGLPRAVAAELIVQTAVGSATDAARVRRAPGAAARGGHQPGRHDHRGDPHDGGPRRAGRDARGDRGRPRPHPGAGAAADRVDRRAGPPLRRMRRCLAAVLCSPARSSRRRCCWPAAPAPRPDPVQVAEVGRATVAEVVDAPGTVAARASATLSAPADGTVEAVLVADGAAVTRGTVLVRLSSPAAQERLRQARAARAAASGAQVAVPQADLGPLQDPLDEAAAAASFDRPGGRRGGPRRAARAASRRRSRRRGAVRRDRRRGPAGDRRAWRPAPPGCGEALAALGSSQRRRPPRWSGPRRRPSTRSPSSPRSPAS